MNNTITYRLIFRAVWSSSPSYLKNIQQQAVLGQKKLTPLRELTICDESRKPLMQASKGIYIPEAKSAEYKESASLIM
jgi:hypothetical protein